MAKFRLLVSAKQLGSRPAVITKGRVTESPHTPYGVRAGVLSRVSLPVPDGVSSPVQEPLVLRGDVPRSCEEKAARLGHLIPTETSAAAKP